MKSNRQLINEINRMLDDGFGRSLNERISYDDASDMDFELNSPGYDYGSDMGFDKAPAQGNNIKSIIDSIRKMSISGISQLSDTPDSPYYDLLKKIWQLVDKTVEVKDNDSDKNKK